MRLIRTFAAALTLVAGLTSLAWGQTRTPGVIPGCIYLSTPPTLTDKQQSPLLCDVNGSLKVGTPVAGGSTGQVQYNNGGVLAGMSGTSWDNTNRSLTITGTGVGTDSTLSIVSGAAASQFTVLDNGNVGVGIALPLVKFSVSGGSIGVTDGDIAVSSTTDADQFLSLSTTATNSYSYIKGAAKNSGGTARGWRMGYSPVSDSLRLLASTSIDSTGGLAITASGNVGIGMTAPSTLLTLASSGVFGWDNGAGTADLIMSRKAAANLVLGDGDAASPVAQTLGAQSVVAGTANTAGAAWTLKGSAGTGTGVGGNIKWQVALAGGAGSAQNAFTDALTIDASAAVPRVTAGGPIKLAGYAIASLPAGSVGDTAYVTDQLTACPVLGGTFTNGGNVVCSAFFDGASWTHQ